MSEQELWDKFYEHAWNAVLSGDEDGYFYSECDLEEEIFAYICFEELFERVSPHDETFDADGFAVMYSQTRTMPSPDWSFLIQRHRSVWELFKEMYPECAAIEILYA